MHNVKFMAVLAEYVYTYKEFDFWFLLLSMLHTVPVKMEINKHSARTTQLKKDR